MKLTLLFSMLAAWNLFGPKVDTKPAPAPAPQPAKVSEDALRIAVSNAVEREVRAAVAAAAEKAAKAATEEKAAREKQEAAEKAAKEAAKADAKEAREIAKEKREFAKQDREIAEKAEADRKAAKLEELRRIESHIFKLQHASAEEVAEKFNAMWNGDFGVNWKITKMAVAFPESNSIMMTAPKVIILACEQSLKELDVEAPQVYIEARFVELGNSASHKVGIDWAFLDGMTLTGSAGAGMQYTKVGDRVSEYTKTLYSGKNTESYKVTGSGTTDTTGDDNGMISYFNGTLSLSQMAMTLKMLDSSQDAKTFSNPKIIVSSGKKATVDMTTKYPNVKVSAKRTDSTGSQALDIASNMEAIPGEDKFMFAKEAFFSWGISLEVTPRISTNGMISVSIVPTISSLDTTQGNGGWIETGTSDSSSDNNGTVSTKYPIIKVQRLISEFNLASGTTAVIGGLSITEESQADNGIPVLREIPWIGTRWFGSMERVKSQKEIIVFVTVGLVDPHKIDPDEGLPKNAILGRQYTQGQKLEPGDRPQRNMEGFDSLDLRTLEEQARDPLNEQKKAPFGLPFQKDPDYRKNNEKGNGR